MNNFHPSETEFNIQNAIFLAKLSNLCYENEDGIRQQIQQEYNFPNFALIERTENGFDTEALILGNDEAVFLIFRGTETEATEDWLNNIDINTIPMFYGNIHRGFWMALQQIGDVVEEKITLFQDKNQPLWFAGHSQGGALAMLAARAFFEGGKSVQGVYTFGQPKVGDLLFATNYSVTMPDSTFRICNEGDSIIDNPPGLYHTGKCLQLAENGEINLVDNLNLIETGGDSFSSVLDSLFDVASGDIQKHSMSEYIARLEK